MNNTLNSSLVKTASVAALAIGALALGVAPMSAQTKLAPRFSLDVGTDYLLASAARDTVGSVGSRTTLGFEFKGLVGQSTLAAEFRRHTKNGKALNGHGLWYSERITFGDDARVVPYVGVGVGVVKASIHATRWVKTVKTTSVPVGSGGYGNQALASLPAPEQASTVVVVNNGTTITTTTTSTDEIKVSDQSWAVAARVVAGVQMANGLYVEVGAQSGKKVLGLRTDSATASLGLRF